jgi:hypothetical protein
MSLATFSPPDPSASLIPPAFELSTDTRLDDPVLIPPAETVLPTPIVVIPALTDSIPPTVSVPALMSVFPADETEKFPPTVSAPSELNDADPADKSTEPPTDSCVFADMRLAPDDPSSRKFPTITVSAAALTMSVDPPKLT